MLNVINFALGIGVTCIDSGTDLNKITITKPTMPLGSQLSEGERDRSLQIKAPKRYWPLSHPTQTNETKKRNKNKTKTNKNKINYINQIKI